VSWSDRWRTRRRPRRLGPPLWLSAVLASILGWIWFEGGGLLPPVSSNGAVVQILDGDSLRIGSRDIRIAGYDAPEWNQFCTTGAGLPWPCGLMARRQLATLIRGGGLECTPVGDDRYGRTLAHCRVAAGDLGSMMVREGLGLRTRQMPFRYQVEETDARAHARGVWQGPHRHPEDFRHGE
jgi:endonuclease YncB( thermonuclease family)